MRVSGKLNASLGYGQIGEVLTQDPAKYLRSILEQCRQIHDLITRSTFNTLSKPRWPCSWREPMHFYSGSPTSRNSSTAGVSIRA